MRQHRIKYKEPVAPVEVTKTVCPYQQAIDNAIAAGTPQSEIYAAASAFRLRFNVFVKIVFPNQSQNRNDVNQYGTGGRGRHGNQQRELGLAGW